MIPTIIIGLIFFAIVGFGAFKSLKSIRNNTCIGCSGGCSAHQRSVCKGAASGK